MTDLKTSHELMKYFQRKKALKMYVCPRILDQKIDFEILLKV